MVRRGGPHATQAEAGGADTPMEAGMNVQEVIAQLGGVDGLKELGAKFGLSPEDAVNGAQGLLENASAGDPQQVAQAAAAKTGLDANALVAMLPGLLAMLGGAGGVAEQASKMLMGSPLGGLLAGIDKDKDGNIIEDLADLAGGLFGKKGN